MSHSGPARTAARPVGAAILAVVVLASLAVALRVALAGTHGAGRAGARVFDDHAPTVANLDRRLLRALREAATDAAADGIELVVNSGWRSRASQGRLRREAIATFGSTRAAGRWVADPDTSFHVSGDAVDIGPARAAAWLSRHGARYGLCRVYRNEPWHFERRPEAVVDGCPAMYADPTHDPRMHE
jgi:hypothetical protein